MKKAKNFMLILIIAFLIVPIASFNTSAATNPYPQWQTLSGVTTVRCTWYAWQQAYDNTGVALPNFGNAKNWYTSAQSQGYSVGSVAKPNSIAVWTDSSYGHVGYVTSVSGSTMKVNEGGMHTTSGTAANGNGIINGSTCYTTVGGVKSQYSSKILVGFIYLTGGTASNVTISNAPDRNSVSDTNAILYGRIDKSSSASISKIGIKVWKDGTSESSATTKYETPSKSYTGETLCMPYYNLNSELNLTLTHATKYYYKVYGKVDGAEYWSSATSFTTTGSHSYGSWQTVNSADCTNAGTKKRSCSCGATENGTIAKLGHNYSSSWTVDKKATCTTAGSKSHHCTRCDAKTDVTAISATGHSYGSWQTVKAADCTNAGTKKRTCSCGATENGTISALGHNYSSSWTVDKKATCITAGSKSHHCTRCNAVNSSTTISPLGHNFGEWKITENASTEKNGKAVRTCKNSGCNQSENMVIPKLSEDGHTHEFGEMQVESAADCTNEGVMSAECEVCGIKQSQSIAALGHSFGDWMILKQPTNTEDGLQERICFSCNEKEQNKIARLISDLEDETEKTDKKVNYKESNSKSYSMLFWIISGIGTVLIAASIVAVLIIKRKHR